MQFIKKSMRFKRQIIEQIIIHFIRQIIMKFVRYIIMQFLRQIIMLFIRQIGRSNINVQTIYSDVKTVQDSRATRGR